MNISGPNLLSIRDSVSAPYGCNLRGAPPNRSTESEAIRHRGSPPTPDPFDELVRRAVTGEAEAYRGLLAETYRWTERFIGARIQPPERREEVLQDVLLSVHRSFATYDPRYPFRAWLRAVVTSRVRDALRLKYATIERLTDEGYLPDQAAPDTGADDGVHEILESALRGLNEIQRRIFTALKLEGRTVRETAAELGMSEGATKVAAHRAYQKIRTRLTKEDAE